MPTRKETSGSTERRGVESAFPSSFAHESLSCILGHEKKKTRKNSRYARRIVG